MTSNDWGSRLAANARKSAKDEAKGMGSIARYVRDDVMPYIGMRMQEGAMVWRPDSDEAVASVLTDLLDASGVLSVKGMKKGSAEFTDTRNVQAFIRRAVNFYRAASLLTEKTGISPVWTENSEPQFPLAWFTPEDADVVNAKGVKTHAPFSGRNKLGFLILKDGEVQTHYCTISEASIVGLSKPKATRERPEDTSGAEDASPVAKAGNLISRMLDQAEENPANALKGDAADALEDIIQRVVRSDDWWTIALAERAKYEKEQAAQAA